MVEQDSHEAFRTAVEHLFDVFSSYVEGDAESFCGFCYTPDEIELYRTTPLRELSTAQATLLLHEASDHWPSLESFKHFLPRILQALGPPECASDLFPAHIFDVLNFQAFATWSDKEKTAVLKVFDLLMNFVHEDDVEEFRDAFANILIREQPHLPR